MLTLAFGSRSGSPPFFIHPTLLISILVPHNHLCAYRLFCLLQNVSFALCSSWVEKCCWELNLAASSSATSGQCLLVISLLSPCRWSFPQWPEPDTFWCCLLVWTSQVCVCLVLWWECHFVFLLCYWPFQAKLGFSQVRWNYDCGSLHLWFLFVKQNAHTLILRDWLHHSWRHRFCVVKFLIYNSHSEIWSQVFGGTDEIVDCTTSWGCFREPAPL